MKRIASAFIAIALGFPLVANSADSTGDSSAKTYVKDSVITAKVKTGLAEEKASSLVNINVDTDNQGVVTLSGTATNQQEIDHAVNIAQGIKGVTSVQNNIKIKGE